MKQLLIGALHSLTRRLEHGRPPKAPLDPLREITRRIGDDWKESVYYDQAEASMPALWADLIWPLIADCDFSVVLDLAAGHGRNTEKLRQHARRVFVADINEENIAFCRRRFAGDSRIDFIPCDGLTLPGIPDGTVSLVYTFDAMVHFDSDTVRAYLKEFRRILKQGGRGFCHHSNHTSNPSGDFHESPGWRNFMSRELFEHYAHKEGLAVVKATVVDWSADQLDCLTVFERR